MYQFLLRMLWSDNLSVISAEFIAFGRSCTQNSKKHETSCFLFFLRQMEKQEETYSVWGILVCWQTPTGQHHAAHLHLTFSQVLHVPRWFALDRCCLRQRLDLHRRKWWDDESDCWSMWTFLTYTKILKWKCGVARANQVEKILNHHFLLFHLVQAYSFLFKGDQKGLYDCLVRSLNGNEIGHVSQSHFHFFVLFK